eukprot:CAMPEP_0174827334 /NCGR_PEP_ID=MMETSP1114-20130205/644_1 /TAXON_ID=312471 /ORGANISM="Neobodo designis, Strain CCAP 1951/1" /LENGTH=321 /DNA_ID=CAMNT_0016060967 /DNA_START=28 /DNA_END=993 /DNA_ORIENTATION=+
MSNWGEPTKSPQGNNNAYPGLQQGGYSGQGAYPAAQPQQQPYGYPGAEGPAAPYPGMQGSPVMGTAASAPGGCTLTREQLDIYLQQSGYGANAAMFGCYFTREAPNAPVYCIACHQPIAFHRSGTLAAAMDERAALLVSEPAPQNLTARTPSNLLQSPHGDVLQDPVWFSNVWFWAWLTVFSLAALIFHLLFFRLEFFIIWWSVSSVLCFVLASVVPKTTIRFSPNAGTNGSRDGGQHRTAEVTEQRILTWCCPVKYTVDVDSLRSVEMRKTSECKNGQIVQEVVATFERNGGAPFAAVLYRGLDAAQELVNWRAYLSGHS